MITLIILFGVLILLAGLVIVVSPETIFGYLRRNMHRPALRVAAVVMRLVIGVLLISQAGRSRYPLVIEILGWLSIAAALLLAVMGRRNFNTLMAWAFTFVGRFGRASGAVAAAFGGFLVHAFV